MSRLPTAADEDDTHPVVLMFRNAKLRTKPLSATQMADLERSRANDDGGKRMTRAELETEAAARTARTRIE